MGHHHNMLKEGRPVITPCPRLYRRYYLASLLRVIMAFVVVFLLLHWQNDTPRPLIVDYLWCLPAFAYGSALERQLKGGCELPILRDRLAGAILFTLFPTLTAYVLGLVPLTQLHWWICGLIMSTITIAILFRKGMHWPF